MNYRADKYFDVDELLHPASAFGHPSEVVNDPDLTSDACAIEATPELRFSPSGTRVRFEEIMEALRTLDKEANGHNYRRVLHKRGAARRGGNNRRAAGTPLQ